jgi:anti-sigma-K factor RskA
MTIVNIELYIQSGIVESYVLGLATPAEVQEFEQLLPHFPELKDALSDFEYQLELFAIDNEVPPPPGSRERIQARLREMPAVRRPVHEERRYKRGSTGEYIRVDATSDQIKVHKYWRVAFIAIFILSKILLALAIYYFIEYRHAQKQIINMEQQTGKKTS